jgi:hypothetical protein
LIAAIASRRAPERSMAVNNPHVAVLDHGPRLEPRDRRRKTGHGL